MGTCDPGPWIATRGRVSNRWFVETEPEGDCTIAMISVSQSAEANARLIAAAPELLTALKRMVNDSMFKDHPEATQMALDAIAKAEAHQPDNETAAWSTTDKP